jgi:hypothetical protein
MSIVVLLTLCGAVQATVLTGAGGNTNVAVPEDHGSNVQDTPHIALTWAPTGGAVNARKQWEQYNGWPGGGEGGAVYQIDGWNEGSTQFYDTVHTIAFTPEAGYGVVLTSLDLNVWSGGGNTSVNWAVTGSLGRVLGSGTWETPNGSVVTHTINLAGNGSETLTLSLQQISGHTAYLAMDNLTFSENFSYLVPDPFNSETDVRTDLADRNVPGAISWDYINDPNISQIVGYDVYFDANEVLVTTGSPSVKVANNQSNASYIPTLDWGKTYYWRVDMNVYFDFIPSTDPNTVVGPVWSFTTKQEDAAPVVNAGDNILTTLALASPPNALVLDGSVTDDYSSPLTIKWEAFEVTLGGGLTTKVVFADATDPRTAVTISEAGTYILQLTATDNNGSFSDQMEIVVFEDACLAKKATGTWVANYYDRNGDCIVDLEDFAIFAAEWLNSTALTESWVYAGAVVGPEDNGLVAEYWVGISGLSPNNLLADPRYPNSPDGAYFITDSFRAKFSGDNYGQRIRGYIVPPVTGNYTFYIASDDGSRLFLSTGTSPVNTDPALGNHIAEAPGSCNIDQWDKFPEQTSEAISLTAGSLYYVEVLHKEGGGSDHVSVGWKRPGETTIEVIPVTYLRYAIP